MNNYLNQYIVRLAIIARALITVAVAFTGGAIAQTADTKPVNTTITSAAPNVQTVDARQSGIWTVGVDPTKNTVQLSNTIAQPLPVQVIGSGSARRPFQARVAVNPTNTAFASQALPLPAGKRLVIENISAIGRFPFGLHMELNFFSYLDNGDGVGDTADISFHRIALVEQGTFDGTTIASANHKVLVFADERIGNTPMNLYVQARLSGPTTAFAQGQVTFSGYVEDLPPVP